MSLGTMMSTNAKKSSSTGRGTEEQERIADLKSCFVIMPIADMEGYETGHFKRVYEHLIRPACQAAGYQTHRADYVASSNYIIIDILKKIVESDIVICDLSGRNPNVLYELGVRQAFNLPTVLIKDIKTPRIFDIQGLRTTEYSQTLRIDEVQNDINSITLAITETIGSPHDVNSMIQLLGIEAAKLPKHVEVSPDTNVILSVLKDLSNRLRHLEKPKTLSFELFPENVRAKRGYMINGMFITTGQELFVQGQSIGYLIKVDNHGVYVDDRDLGETIIYTPDDPAYEKITLSQAEITAADL